MINATIQHSTAVANSAKPELTLKTYCCSKALLLQSLVSPPGAEADAYALLQVACTLQQPLRLRLGGRGTLQVVLQQVLNLCARTQSSMATALACDNQRPVEMAMMPSKAVEERTC